MRKCIEVVVEGLRLRATAHLPPAGAPTKNHGFKGLGVVILSPAAMPRSAVGDLSAAMGDALAENGLLTVRLDQPGNGDSEGEMGEDVFQFIEITQEGAFAESSRQAVEKIKEQLGLERVIIAGFCGGAITAFFTAAASRNGWPNGMFVLDPAFHLVEEAGGPDKKVNRERERQFRRQMLWREITLLRMRLPDPMRNVFRQVRQLVRRNGRVAHGAPTVTPGINEAVSPELPAEANLPLLKCAKQLLKRHVPILFVTAVDDHKRSGEYSYVEYLLRDKPPRATHVLLEGTDHSFVAGDGKTKVIRAILDWAAREFGQPVG
jgi:pimeloyl-ACP methyl ester carboxylesterase